MLHSCDGYSITVHYEDTIINRGEAEIDNYIWRVNIRTITFITMLYVLYYIELPLKM